MRDIVAKSDAADKMILATQARPEIATISSCVCQVERKLVGCWELLIGHEGEVNIDAAETCDGRVREGGVLGSKQMNCDPRTKISRMGRSIDWQDTTRSLRYYDRMQNIQPERPVSRLGR